MTWTIVRRIALGYTLGLGLVLVIAFVGWQALQDLDASYRRAQTVQRRSEYAVNAKSSMLDANLMFFRYLLEPDAAQRDVWRRGRDSLLALTQREVARLEREAPGADDRAAWEAVAPVLNEWRDHGDEAMRLVDATRREEARLYWDREVRPRAARAVALTDRNLTQERAVADSVLGATAERADRARRMIFWGGGLALMVGIVSALLLNRAVAGPLQETTRVLATTASEILAATAQQASGASESMASVAETAATVDQVAQTAEQAADRARLVADGAQRTAELGRRGRLAAGDSAEAMGALRGQVESMAASVHALAEQAQAIGEIIVTTEEIAERTNLLALNAAIEAARAGEEGRSFGIVATEIRSLAEQSRRAGTQVRQILGDIQRTTAAAVVASEEGARQVASGVAQVAATDDTIRQLDQAAADAAQAAAQIVASAGQQSAGMVQIRQAMRNIQDATHQNLAATQQTERAAQDLTRLGHDLLQLVGGGALASAARRLGGERA